MLDSHQPLQLLLTSFNAVIPAFGWIVFGIVLRRIAPGSLSVFRFGEKFVFYIGMPTVLGISASQQDFLAVKLSGYILAGTVAFCVVVVAAYQHARWQGFSLAHRGVVVQSAYRGNLAIIGFALCASAFGQQGLVLAAMPIAIWTVLFNIIAVVLLGHTHGGHSSPMAAVKGMAKNPLIIGITIGAAVSLSGVEAPAAVYDLGDFLTQTVIPFALICLGGSISLKAAKSAKPELISATVWRLIIAPLVTVFTCLAFGVRGLELGVTFLLLGGPAAVACHVMVSAVGGNGRLAANIVMITTLLAPISLSLGLFLLSYLSLLNN